MKRTFFIIGGYNFGNPGDEAILKTTLKNIQMLYPTSHFLIWRDQKKITFRFDKLVATHYVTFNPVLFLSGGGWGSNKMRALYRWTYFLSSRLAKICSKHVSRIVSLMSRSDVVIFVGGGYLNSYYNLVEMHFLFSLAHAAGKPVILLGQTLGPVFGFGDRRMLDEMCRFASAVTVREKRSLDWTQNSHVFKELGMDEAVCFSPEMAESDLAPLRDLLNEEEKVVRLGLNLRYAIDGRNDYPALFESLKRFAQSIPLPVRTLLIPMETSVYCDDRDEFDYFLKHSERSLRFEHVPKPLSVEQKHYLFSKMDLVFSMRYHGQVFALSSAVPCLGAYKGPYYAQKSNGLFGQFGLEKYCIPIEESHRVAGLLSELYQNKEDVRQRLLTKTGEFQSRQRSILKKVFSIIFLEERPEK